MLTELAAVMSAFAAIASGLTAAVALRVRFNAHKRSIRPQVALQSIKRLETRYGIVVDEIINIGPGTAFGVSINFVAEDQRSRILSTIARDRYQRLTYAILGPAAIAKVSFAVEFTDPPQWPTVETRVLRAFISFSDEEGTVYAMDYTLLNEINLPALRRADPARDQDGRPLIQLAHPPDAHRRRAALDRCVDDIGRLAMCMLSSRGPCKYDSRMPHEHAPPSFALLGRVGLFFVLCAVVLAAVGPMMPSGSGARTLILLGIVTSALTLTFGFVRWEGLAASKVGIGFERASVGRFAAGLGDRRGPRRARHGDPGERRVAAVGA